jgi:hypothetical protein
LPRHSVWPIFPGVRSFLNCLKLSVTFMCRLTWDSCLRRYVHSSIWDVQVPNDEDEAGGHAGGGVIVGIWWLIMAGALAL